MTKKFVTIVTLIISLLFSSGVSAQGYTQPPTPFQPGQTAPAQESPRTIAAQIQHLMTQIQGIWNRGVVVQRALNQLRQTRPMNPHQAQMIQQRFQQLNFELKQLESTYFNLVRQVQVLQQRLMRLVQHGTPGEWAREVVGVLGQFSNGDPTMEMGANLATTVIDALMSAGVLR